MAARIVLLLLILISPATAHEWYPVACCGGRDCGPINPSRVVALPDGGYKVDGIFIVSAGDVHFSLDGRFHACFASTGLLRCFFAPDRNF